MSTTEWHVDAGLWQAYVAGRLDPVAVGSIDAHVAGCERCRHGARAMVGSEDLLPIWEGIRAEMRRPALPRSVRWLRRVGVPDDDLVILAASDGFLLPWAMAIGSALLCLLLSVTVTNRQQEVFMLLAPLVPVLAVIAAHDAIDPLRQLVTTTPYSKLRLALLRTTATLAVALPATLAIGLTVPGLESLAFVWLAPALALTTTALVLLTWVDPWVAAGSVASGWTVIVLATARVSEVEVLGGVWLQTAFAAGVLIVGSGLVVRTSSFRLLGGEG